MKISPNADATLLTLDVVKLPAVCREISGNSIDFDQTADGLVSTHLNAKPPVVNDALSAVPL